MKVFTMANVVTVKRGAIFVCVVFVAALFIHNSRCLCSSFFNNDRALSQVVEIVDQLFPPAVTICFPIMAILDISKVPSDLLSVCRPYDYFTATKNGKIEYDDECVKALTNWANESSWHSVKPCNLTYTLWDLVTKVEVLDPNDMRLVEYNITGPNSFMKLEVNATKMGDYNCFSIHIFANQSSIFYEKSKLTTDVLVDPFIELQFNSKVSKMDMSYLILHGNRTRASGAETSLLLEYHRSYIVGYEAEMKNYVPGNFFGDSCMDYGKKQISPRNATPSFLVCRKMQTIPATRTPSRKLYAVNNTRRKIAASLASAQYWSAQALQPVAVASTFPFNSTLNEVSSLRSLELT
ncbi:hypothetical protein HDE_12109 [Halotydeus destructor]|nr:hypothetical protein HDE_12109 [Halotydeus destructor]